MLTCGKKLHNKFCSCLLFCQSERELMKSIIPEQSQSTIFDKLIQAAMDDFISEGEVLVLTLSLVDFST